MYNQEKKRTTKNDAAPIEAGNIQSASPTHVSIKVIIMMIT